MPLIVISGYQDFNYLKHAFTADAVDYLLKPFSREAIGTCVRKAIERLENSQFISQQITDSHNQRESARYEYDIQYLTNLILGFYTGDGAITSEKLKFINNTHQLVLLTLYSDNQFAELNIQDWLEENGFGDLALYLSNSTQPGTGFLILFLPRAKAVKAENLVNQITDALLMLARQHTCSLLIGISHTHSDLMDLHTAFQETSNALNQQKLDGPTLCSYVCDDSIAPRQVIWENEDKFLFYIEAAKQDEICQLTEQLFHWFCSIPSFTLNDAKYYCFYLSNQCKDILNYYLEQDVTKASASVQNVVSRLFRINELKEYYLQFYLNRSYLSTLFKQRTGMKFIDYLNDVRIGKASELLRNSNRKMYQISKAVGYDNPKYFFRIFKKKMGCSPEQYRNKCHDK